MADDTAMEIDEEDEDEDFTMGATTSKGRTVCTSVIGFCKLDCALCYQNAAPPLPSAPAPPTHPPLPSMPPPPAPPGTQPRPPGVLTNTPIRKDYDPKGRLFIPCVLSLCLSCSLLVFGGRIDCLLLILPSWVLMVL